MKHRNSRSALFLMELIFAILFFAIASAVCVQLFVRAHLTSRDTQDLNQAMAGAQSAAAVLQAEQGDLAAASVLLEGSQMEDGVLTLRYDADWQPAEEEAQTSYLLQMTPDEEQTTRITVTRIEDGEVLIVLPLYCHTPLTLS